MYKVKIEVESAIYRMVPSYSVIQAKRQADKLY